MISRTPPGIGPEAIESWLRRAGEIRATEDGYSLVIDTEAMQNFAEYVAAAQREVIAQVLEGMPDGVAANMCGAAVRRMRAQH